ncbi:Gfo/Idh/MocA family oxidoreductase [Pontibacter beigongshangensis]|uniref:Gfo/Idh/MocA family oxidoreductase n=1 Tax=Pontibacter beigongshangensis TaxID=2574733 RepID=UPI0016509A6B|nr:Gfo/Idh/MocA family oxidoreductase [Pontibacter beigongshangensis]
MKRIFNVGLIGFGLSGRVFQAPFLTLVEGFVLKKIRSTSEENIQIARARYPQAQIVGHVNDIFQDESIDLVIVASSSYTHFELAKEALLAGKHVVVEKPFTTTTAEADELIQLAKDRQRTLTAFQNRRWDSDFKTVRKVIESGLLGNLVEYEAHFDRFRNFLKPNTWKEEDLPGSGMLYDLGSHLIDQALCLFGLPKELSCDLRIQREGGRVIDNFRLVLQYPALRVTLRAGMLVREAGPRYTLLGDQGSFLKFGLDVQEETLVAGILPTDKPDEEWGKEPEELWGRLNTDYKGMHLVGKIESEQGHYKGYFQNLYNALIGEEELEVKPEQARNIIRVIELAIKSSQEQRTVTFE